MRFLSVNQFLLFVETLLMFIRQGFGLLEAMELIRSLDIIPKTPLNTCKKILNQSGNLTESLNSLLMKPLQLPVLANTGLPKTQGFLEEVMARFKQYKEAKQLFFKALMYPCLLFFLSVALAFFLILVLMPMLQSLFSMSKLYLDGIKLMVMTLSFLMMLVILGFGFRIYGLILNWRPKDRLFWHLATYRAQGLFLKESFRVLKDQKKGISVAFKKTCCNIRRGETVEKALGDAFKLSKTEKQLLKKAFYKGGVDGFCVLCSFTKSQKERQALKLIACLKPILLMLFCIQVLILIGVIYFPMINSLSSLKI